MASVIARKSSTSKEGTPSGVRAWMWIIDAPSSTARLASAAYSSGVYGIAGHCSRLATAPEIEQVTIAGSSNRLMRSSLGSGVWRGRLAPPEVPLEHQVDARHRVAVHARLALRGERPVAGQHRDAGREQPHVLAHLERQRAWADRRQRQPVGRVDAQADPLVADVEDAHVDLLRGGAIRARPERPADEAGRAAGVGAG